MRLNIFHNSGLQNRFLFRVLLPPFFMLLIVSIVAYVLLSIIIRNSEVDSMRRAANTTAAKLESEIDLRKRVLLGTGENIFATKKDYQDARTNLDDDYKTCHTHIASEKDFTKAPANACEPFFSGFASALQDKTSLMDSLNDQYKSIAAKEIKEENSSMQKQLAIYNSFFSEASWLVVVDKSGELVQQASVESTDPDKADDPDKYADLLKGIGEKAVDGSVEGQYELYGQTRQLAFAYPIEDRGAIVATYNLDSKSFLYPSWNSAPIDSSKAFVIVADKNSEQGYPKIKDKSLFLPVLDAEESDQTDFKSANIEYLATSVSIGNTSWRVIIASPSAYALAPLATAQIIAVLVIGGLLVIFLWEGSRFIKRTVDSILTLVGGAVIFSSGLLTHKISIEHMSDKEFAQLADVMNHMAEKIQEAEEAIKQKDKEFISVATHEIKAPMTAIIGNLSMLLEDGMGKLDEDARKLTEQAYKGTVRLRDLVNELLDIARLESGRAKFNLEQIDLADEIMDMIELQKTPAEEKHVGIHYQPSDSPVLVTADKNKLEIILTNFISNGIKYNRSPGAVSITHNHDGGLVTITIKDTGLGIPKEQQEKMFQKFFRVEHSDRAGVPGTGLGMYITKQFIEGMGGKLWFESEHGKGTTFHFTVPLANTSSHDGDATSSS